ncbi:MAG TPA: elongation factor P [Vicinamibacteria bacterium]|jgi:elongation factor P|nr:elongation factor P [Vicinamibacteria bacterium]
MIQATQMKRGMCIKHDNDLYRVVATQHITPGNWRGMVQAKIRHLKSGSIIEHRFRSDDRVERAILDETEMEFLYKDGDMYHFMNNESFEQMALSAEVLGDAVPYLFPNIKLKIEMYEERPVGIELPLTVELKVVETEPAIKGASVSNQSKPARMETGLMVQVPPFIAEGDVIKIDTASGAYIERAK